MKKRKQVSYGLLSANFLAADIFREWDLWGASECYFGDNRARTSFRTVLS